MGYIMSLRKLVGHIPLLQVGASVIVVDECGRILLQLRSDNNTWGYAGGSVEIDENVEDTAKRELYEETGLIAKEITLLGVFSGKDMHNIYPNGDEVSNIDIVYICKNYDGELKCQPGEVENLKFFDISDLPINIFKPNLPAIEEYISKYTIRWQKHD